jgi:hypothetical protein
LALAKRQTVLTLTGYTGAGSDMEPAIMTAVLRISLIVLLCSLFSFSSLTSQQAEDGWTHLGTLWDAPGYIGEISPDSQFVSITQEGVSRVVQIETGEVVAEITGNAFQFSPGIRYAHSYSFETKQATIIDLHTGIPLVVDGVVDKFLDHERFAAVSQYYPIGDFSRLIDLATGEIVAEFPAGAAFSPDARYAAVTDRSQQPHMTTQVIEIATGNVLAEYEYDYPPDRCCWGPYLVFHTSVPYLSIFYLAREVQLIDTATWQVLYKTPSLWGIVFSSDGRYLATMNDDGQSDVHLLDASSGRVLDTVFGSFSFSADSRYLFRRESVDYDLRRLEIVELSTNEVVFTLQGYFGETQLVTDTLLQVMYWREQKTRYFDISSGEMIYEVEGYAELHHDLLVIEDISTQMDTLRTWEDPETVIATGQIEVTPDGKYALVSSDGFVDVYGLASERPSTMPPRSEM